MRHDLGSEELDGAHGLLVAEVPPLERADEIVGAGFHILVQVFTQRGRRARDHPGAEPTWIQTTALLLLRTRYRGERLAPHFPIWGGSWTGSHPIPEELIQPPLLGLQTA